jgi:hypothetical protein
LRALISKLSKRKTPPFGLKNIPSLLGEKFRVDSLPFTVYSLTAKV